MIEKNIWEAPVFLVLETEETKSGVNGLGVEGFHTAESSNQHS